MSKCKYCDNTKTITCGHCKNDQLCESYMFTCPDGHRIDPNCEVKCPSDIDEELALQNEIIIPS